MFRALPRKRTIHLSSIVLAHTLSVGAFAQIGMDSSVPLMPAATQGANPADAALNTPAKTTMSRNAGISLSPSGVIVLTASQLADVQRRANQGEAEAQYIIGSAYRGGGPLLQQNDAAALTWFRKAADQGHVGAQRAMGYGYVTGKGVGQDYSEALRWYNMAAERGDPISAYYLGVFHLFGRAVPKNSARALEWFRIAASKGIASAQCALGFMYSKGEGVHRNLAQAFALQHAAAEKGLAKAQNELGVMYLRGEGTRRDPVEAFRWFEAAAKQGETDAQNNIGYLYDTGVGVKTNTVEAVRWFRTAAELGDPVAEANLGGMYARGRGVPLDYVEAYKWFSLAATQNLKVAGQARSNIAPIMTPRQVRAAEDRISEWRKGHPLPGTADSSEETVYLHP